MACIQDLRPPMNSYEESPHAEDFVGPAVSLQLETERSSPEPPLNYQRSTKIGCCRLDPRARASVPRALGCSVDPFLGRTGGPRWAFLFVLIFFPVQAATDGLYMRLILVVFLAFIIPHLLFLPLVAPDPFSRARRLLGRRQRGSDRMYSNLLISDV